MVTAVCNTASRRTADRTRIFIVSGQPEDGIGIIQNAPAFFLAGMRDVSIAEKWSSLCAVLHDLPDQQTCTRSDNGNLYLS